MNLLTKIFLIFGIFDVLICLYMLFVWLMNRWDK